jgi:HK97 family phage portal protein
MFETTKSKLLNKFFGKAIQTEIEKASRQVVSQISTVSALEGVLPDIDFEIFNQMYEQTSWVRAVVGVICKAVTARGYTIVPTQPNADPQNAALLTEFFSNCNPNDTLLEILDDITRDEYVFGNAFIEVVYGADGKPKELWNLDATTMRVKADDHGGITGYIQIPKWAAPNSSGKIEFAANEVIHFKLGTKGATLYGLSPLASLILPITVDKFAQIYNRSFFSNGAKIRGAFIMKDATAEQVERNREYLQARAKNPDMAHSDLVLEGQIEFKQIGVNQKDMEFLDLREFTRNEILAVYGVPPGKVSIIETGNIGAGSGDHQTQTFYEETILPFQMRLAEKINKLIVRSGFGITDWAFQFNKRAIDEKDQAEVFNIYLQNGVLTAEEVRRIVAPRLPEIQKGFSKQWGLTKGKISPKRSIVGSTQTIVALENRFVRALDDLFRDIKSRISASIPSVISARSKPHVEKIELEMVSYTVHSRGINFNQVQFTNLSKQLNDLELILELIDEEGIAKVIKRFSLEAAQKALKLAAQRNNLEDIEDISQDLKEFLDAGALDLAGNISSSIKDSVRKALIDGLAANESLQDLQKRVEEQIDSFATFDIKPVLDSEGNIVRSGHSRNVSRSTAAEAIARTEANRAFNEGNLDALDQAGISDVQFLLSSDACPECLAVAESIPGNKLGKILGLDEAHEVIPVHPNCRCTWVVP